MSTDPGSRDERHDHYWDRMVRDAAPGLDVLPDGTWAYRTETPAAAATQPTGDGEADATADEAARSMEFPRTPPGDDLRRLREEGQARYVEELTEAWDAGWKPPAPSVTPDSDQLRDEPFNDDWWTALFLATSDAVDRVPYAAADKYPVPHVEAFRAAAEAFVGRLLAERDRYAAQVQTHGNARRLAWFTDEELTAEIARRRALAAPAAEDGER